MFLEKVKDYIEQGLPVNIIVLDFQKTLDKVPRARLMTKMKAYGHIWKWINNWLKDRIQKVVVNETKSSWKYLPSGVPQGSVLMPTLFLISDIDTVIDSLILKLAEDTNLYRSVDTMEQV